MFVVKITLKVLNLKNGSYKLFALVGNELKGV
jgi:hypothetical protein